MPAKSPGSCGRELRKPEAETPSRQKHKYEPFTRRIARLKIDPIHHVSGRAPTDDASDLSQSFFRTSLEEWAELNLSHTFTSFYIKVNPLCENLPQLLHHRDGIFETLVEHIDRKDALALEPLLSLTAHLAHDLSQEFERYFSSTVSLVAHVAATHDAPDVIEWSFTCLAWLFKYLSRLLVQDLRPLLGLMKQYLSHRKGYIARFSAESLAFLLRKSAVLYPKQTGPLNVALTDLLREGDQDHHPPNHGVMALLVETCLGVERAVHSSAADLFRCLILVAGQLGNPEAVLEVAQGALVSLIHRTDAAGFQQIIPVLIENIPLSQDADNLGQMTFILTLLEVVVGTRIGTRIQDWRPVLDTTVILSKFRSQHTSQSSLRRLVLSISAMCLQYSPMDQLLPYSRTLLDAIYNYTSSKDFFTYCTMSADLGRARFTQFLLPRLQQYIISRYNNDETALVCLLEDLHGKGAISHSRGAPGYLESSREWDKAILQRLDEHTDLDSHISDELMAGLGRLARNIKFPMDDTVAQEFSSKIVLHIIDAAIEAQSNLNLRNRLMLGWMLDAYATTSQGALGTLSDIFKALIDVPQQCFRMVPFLEGLINLGQLSGSSGQLKMLQSSKASKALLQNLINCSEQVRRTSLLLLRSLGSVEHSMWLEETIVNLLEVCDTEYVPSNARHISMLLRRLLPRQKQAPADPLLQQLLPLFCVGLLPIYHDKTRKDVCVVLRELVEGSDMEDTVLQILTSWLRDPPTTAEAPGAATPVAQKMSPFECSNLMRVRGLVSQAFEVFESPEERLRLAVGKAHRINSMQIPFNARGLALQALIEMAGIAERRSRQITPVFLAAQLTRSSPELVEPSHTSDSSHTLSPEIAQWDWALSDRKAFLSLFVEFQNPKVLYLSNEVYAKLFNLLSNGSSEIRKLALRAVLKWKDPTLRKHEDFLVKVIEEKIPNTDIGVVLNAESEENPIQANERFIILPVLLRLLYGMIIGRSGAHGSQEARRKTILRMLFRMEEAEVIAFLGIALGNLKDVHMRASADMESGLLNEQLLSADQQHGFLRMVSTLIETLQSQFAPFGKYVVEATLYCTLRACRQIEQSSGYGKSLTTDIRRTGLQCVAALFETCSNLDWEPFMPSLFVEAISTRMDRFAMETAQGISTLLRLFSTWCKSIKHVPYLRGYDQRVLPVTMQILTIDSAKPDVKAFVLKDILMPLVRLASDSATQPNAATEIVSAEMSVLLQCLGVVLQNTPPKDILASTTSILVDLGSLSAVVGATSSVVTLLVDILSTSKKQISPQVRSGVLGAISSLLKSDPGGIDPLTRDKLFELTSQLFNYFKDSQSRLTLCDLLQCLEGQFDAQLTGLCSDLNAVSSDRLDEADYDRRLKAFQQISSLSVDDDSAERWLPILYNLLFLRRVDDFSVRSNAVSCLKDFIETASSRGARMTKKMLTDVLLPEFRKGARDDSETTRADSVTLFGLLVQHLEHEPQLEDMRVLLVGNDEEASFFNNILHVQEHRRLRAIRRLVSEIEKGVIAPRNIVQLFLPLLLKFVRDQSGDDSVQGVKGESLAVMRKILQWVDWKQMKLIFSRHKSELGGEDQNQRTAIKLLAHAADALIQARQDKTRGKMGESELKLPHLAASIPEEPYFSQEVSAQLLVKLRDFTHHKDEAEMSSRLPVAVTAVKLISLLPDNEIHILSAPIVLDVANALRSRAQESRDAARATLKEIVLLLGPGSLQFVVTELRNALKRGYQLHVLSFTVHALLVALSPTLKPGELDYCVKDLALVVMDDTFGVVGQEKENQDYISDMKEVKSSKSFDSMELLARSTSVDHLKLLIEPIITLLTGTLSSKQTRKVDELLRRLGVGLSANPTAGNQQVLVFAYQAIQSFYRERSPTPKQHKTLDEMSKERLLVQLSSASKTGSSSSSPSLYKIARFAIDLVRSALLKHDELLTPENVHGFLSIIGDALVEAQEDVKISALRLLSVIIKMRMVELDQNAPVYVREAVKIVQSANSSNDEAAQAALKLVATILRERKYVMVRDSDIADLLHRIMPDLEEPERQGVSFNFVRAVMSRKYHLPEIYEVVDKIGIMMVTNHTRGARDTARGVYVHFLIDYPQSSSRWTKQQNFLIKNLEYDYSEGRESVLEAINMLLNKISGVVGQQLVSAFFVPVVLRLANDDHEGCSQLAGALLGRIFQKAEVSTRRELLQPLESWVEQTENPPLTKLGMQAFGILFESVQEGLDAQVQLVCEAIEIALKSPASEDGDLPGEALKLLAKLAGFRPGKVLTQKLTPIWFEVRSLLRHPFYSIQHTAASLVWTFCESCQAEKTSELPLLSVYGLRWDDDACRDVMKASVRIVKHALAPAELHEQIVSILVFFGRCIEANGLTVEIKSRPGIEAGEPNPESGDSESSDIEDTENGTALIPAIDYLFHQLNLILRYESPSHFTSSLRPKTSALQLLNLLIPHLSTTTLSPSITRNLLLPLIHMTDPNTQPPRSSDPSFSGTYATMTTSAQELLITIQDKIGDKAYISAMTEASKLVRQRRDERRRKRAIERVAEPERAAREKKRKGERKKERKREIGRSFQIRRRGRGNEQ